jgi:hypothetical protein
MYKRSYLLEITISEIDTLETAQAHVELNAMAICKPTLVHCGPATHALEPLTTSTGAAGRTTDDSHSLIKLHM